MEKLRIVIAKPLAEEYVDRLRACDPRVEVVYEGDLMAPMRWPSDHHGDPNFKRTPEQQARLDELVDSADILYSFPDLDPAELARIVRANPKLKWVHIMAAGGGAAVKAAQLTDEELKRVIFTTSAGVHAGTLAEFALFGVLAGAKQLPELEEDKKKHLWPPSRRLMGMISDMRIVVVGMGAIGQECAKRFHQLGATVIGVNRSIKPVEAIEKLFTSDQIVEAAKGADALVNALPGAVGTEELISREVLEALAPGAIIASVGRGQCIDEDAMIELLACGHLGFAALDVTKVEPLPESSPLWDLPNVVISPHTAANSAKEDSRIADLFIENLHAFLDDAPMRNVVNTKLFY
ncbi:D-2-hydroxyacid dehydrogenase [Propionimicrobium sp. PCR01-08-3]|uniref:D-2-hydroxyacid dehydrogenase n=1 Tax=Propionimicrobium sp. PCR01-08-3 TaxID=3052086 RepID=UPI00255CA0A6|nr:D-2-hydroxyacid dehydrogenase [Propionimicrobium sp. PCR01-08-3]WIY82319.1 D-2-hydroxyacid dehydrogenase [Propionimicrobium sp. PCR01-08-3]